jgi:hypothetical protein
VRIFGVRTGVNTVRCKACDRILEDNELTKKDVNGDYLDMCNNCLYASASVEVDDISTITDNFYLTDDE